MPLNTNNKNDKPYPYRAIAWLGDRVFSLAAYELVEQTQEVFNKRIQFLWTEKLVRNDNLAGGTWIEYEVGLLYKTKGFESAKTRAREYLKTTRVWFEYNHCLTFGKLKTEESEIATTKNETAAN